MTATKWMLTGAAFILIPVLMVKSDPYQHSIVAMFGLLILKVWWLGAAAFGYGFLLSTQDSSLRQRQANDAFAEGYSQVYQCGGGGIAISPERKVLKLKIGELTGSRTKEYAFHDIRGWRTNVSSGGEIVIAGASVAAGLGALGHNRRNAAKNRRESGLYIDARDIDHPEWRIDMPKAADQQRWMEILQQYISEGAS